MINSSFTQSNTFPKIVSAAIDMIFQESLLAKEELNEDDGPIKKVGKLTIVVKFRNKDVNLKFRHFTRSWIGVK
jgi:hypothetical protein